MDQRFQRTEMLLGKASMGRLSSARVAVFGVGGVGGYVVEALARSGIGAVDLCDHDTVDVTNLNRQIIALSSTIGRQKVEVAAERVHDINPDCRVTTYPIFFLPETKDQFDFTQYDYVVDAIDTVTGKLSIIEEARQAGVPVISSMGAGNKLDPTLFRVDDIYKTSVCPLAKVMRRECRRRGIDHLKVVYSTEEREKRDNGDSPHCHENAEKRDNGDCPRCHAKVAPGSVAFVPSVAGLILAGEVIRDLSGKMDL